ncbi:hypothetical protein AB1Y20_005865 [Prymnesium parvum]|uniref:Uncharacterized protein n=1 Tax=Prymnesium parvum TaxID=97485 RepID=A0AB34J397_PRYPA
MLVAVWPLLSSSAIGAAGVPCRHSRPPTAPVAMLLPADAVGMSAAVAALALLFRRGSAPVTDENEQIRRRIELARSSRAPAYRSVAPATEPTPDRRLTPEEEVERAERRQRAQELTRRMLDDVRERLEAGLEEALLNEDDETASEYKEELQRLQPLPEDVSLLNEEADFKRWIDPSSLRL